MMRWMMGTRLSTVAAQQEGMVLRWSAEVTWPDDRSGNASSPDWLCRDSSDGEWCSLGSASDAATGVNAALVWSWTSSWR